jgi:heme-degrading monooxygenase HmoA
MSNSAWSGEHSKDTELKPPQRRRLGFRPSPGCDRAWVQKRSVWRIISSMIADCCRRSSAVQKPRAAPAQLLAALSHKLSHGFDMRDRPSRFEANHRYVMKFPPGNGSSRHVMRAAKAAVGGLLTMVVVIFQVTMRDGRSQDYFGLAAELRPELERIDGFISVERFESLAEPGKYVSLSFWRDEAAIETWRAQRRHRAAQLKGKREIFADFRISVAEVVRDYTLVERLGEAKAAEPL